MIDENLLSESVAFTTGRYLPTRILSTVMEYNPLQVNGVRRYTIYPQPLSYLKK